MKIPKARSFEKRPNFRNLALKRPWTGRLLQRPLGGELRKRCENFDYTSFHRCVVICQSFERRLLYLLFLLAKPFILLNFMEKKEPHLLFQYKNHNGNRFHLKVFHLAYCECEKGDKFSALRTVIAADFWEARPRNTC
ncbi:hypothetical protein AVEN_102995-1 [Araneus ventricosus]|uniref:Uncharacterized protein n=1 Tax=Araneus ventricosus TaxID=182803 RepID=A0A4Y2BAG3_ARAVE|nr:hypothetical protein AVEN_102995-1 [Araneus ventricosus]